MDTSFDLVALLKQQPTTKSHKIRPTQFVSVAGGVQKRLETNIKNRKSSRLTVFDRIRNISKCESPKAPALSDAQQKALHRKQQLDKWKEEKDKKKKEAVALKKKPFVAGVSQRRTFGPPPPPPKPMPSTSGRVTRSQSRLKAEPKPAKTQTKSFAPSNATFKPSLFLNNEVPKLAPVNKKKAIKSKSSITFEPVLPKNLQKETRPTTRATRAKPFANKPVIETKSRKPNDKTKANTTTKNAIQKPLPLKQQMFQSSSSSSDTEQPKLRKKPSLRKSVPPLESTSQDSACDLQDVSISSTGTVSMSSQDHNSQDTASMSSQEAGNTQDIASMSQDTASTSSQDELSTPRNKVPKSDYTVSISSPKACNPQDNASTSSQVAGNPQDIASMSQDTASTSSQDELSTPRNKVPKSDYTVSISSPKACNPQDNASMSSQVAGNPQDIASMSQDTAFASFELSTPRIKLPRSESSSEEKLRSPKLAGELTPEQIAEEAKNISPCVTMSRGKDNARKEMKKKLDEGLLDEDNSNMDSVNHFRRQLNSEIARITAMCDAWDQIFAQTVLPEPIQELVLTAVGQARLLMAQKLQQFAGLVERCARPTPGIALVTPADLHGFWDMVFMQVENVDMRFKNLEELRLRDWIEEKKPEAKKVAAKPAAKKAVVKPSGPSRLREMIAAARKAKKAQESQSENSESEKSDPTTSPETKTFEAGFFRVSSPMKRGSPAPGTPSNKTSLLKSVLSSEAKKSVSKNSSSFAMLRASLMSKGVDIEGVSPLTQTPSITPVNLYATPARSILKQNHPISTKKTEKLKTVLFHESEEPPSPAAGAGRERAGSGAAPLPAGDKDDKENKETPKTKEATPRRSRLSRQNAEEQPSPVMTRSRRKSAQTPLVEADPNVAGRRRSTRKAKEVHEAETPKRSTRRRKSAVAV